MLVFIKKREGKYSSTEQISACDESSGSSCELMLCSSAINSLQFGVLYNIAGQKAQNCSFLGVWPKPIVFKADS
jgi:hypothetical protein